MHATTAQYVFLQKLAFQLQPLNAELTTPAKLLEWLGFPLFPTVSEASAAISEAKRRIRGIEKPQPEARVWLGPAAWGQHLERRARRAEAGRLRR